MTESFLTKWPDYNAILTALEWDSYLSSLLPGWFFRTSPEMIVKDSNEIQSYLYLSPLMNAGEKRSDDTWVIKQNDVIVVTVVGSITKSSTELDSIVRYVYQFFNNNFVLKTVWEVKILSATKVNESPVVFAENRATKFKKLTLTISYSEV